MSNRNHPRIPPEHGGIQVNHCQSPVCANYGVAPEPTSTRGKNRYTLGRSKGIASCIGTFCGVGFPLKSNLGIVEEVERMASYRSPPDAVYGPNESCANPTHRVSVGIARAYASFGKTAIGNPRWRCNICGKTFSRNTTATARPREPHKNKTIFKLLVNQMPVQRIIEVTDIAPSTFSHRLAFFHRQCPAFAAHRERALANLAIRRLSLGVGRQDYLVNGPVRKDKRNLPLSAIAAGDNDHGYGFGIHLNFDPSLDAAAIEAEVDTNDDLPLPFPHRRFARLWLHSDYYEASARSMARKRRDFSLSTATDDTYAAVLTRDDIESPDAPSQKKRLPE